MIGVALWQEQAKAQPNVAPDAKTTVSTFSVAELENFLGGRTLLSVDLKDASLEEVAAALGQASGQKIGTIPAVVEPTTTPGVAVIAPTPPLYSLSANQIPFWEALRGWQLAARRASEAAVLASNAPRSLFGRPKVSNSVGLLKTSGGFTLQADNVLADGRAVAAWPFLLVATELRRTQEAQLSEEGLRDIAPRPLTPQPGIPLPVAPKEPISKEPKPEEQRWLDRFVVNTQAYIDPKLNPVGLRCEIEEAIDDKGNDLRLREGEALSRSVAVMSGHKKQRHQHIITYPLWMYSLQKYCRRQFEQEFHGKSSTQGVWPKADTSAALARRFNNWKKPDFAFLLESGV